MDPLFQIIIQSLEKVWVTFTHNWPFLLASVLISVTLRLYIQPEKASSFLTRYRRAGVVGATAVAVTTPFCSCGTTAVILGMIASTVPWAPIVAFMVASPLTSPEELVYSAGLFGWPFATAFFVSSILLGLLGGTLAEWFETRGWLANQARFAAPTVAASPLQPAATGTCSCESTRQPVSGAFYSSLTFPGATPAMAADACCGTAVALPAHSELAPTLEFSSAVLESKKACACGSEPGVADPSAAIFAADAPMEKAPQNAAKSRVTLRKWIDEVFRTGKQLLIMFLGFAFIGYVLNGLIPASWISTVFGKGNIYSVPLAATLGLPLYINTEGSLPLVRALIDGGMSQGAALAFLITGAGTSIGAVGGALTIARWRVIGLVVGTLWIGSVVLGYAYNLLLAAHLF